MSEQRNKDSSHDRNQQAATNAEENKKKPGPLDVVFSVLSAMIGVQSEKNRERDFSKGDIGNYIFVGIIMVAIFIFSLIVVVNNILEDATK